MVDYSLILARAAASAKAEDAGGCGTVLSTATRHMLFRSPGVPLPRLWAEAVSRVWDSDLHDVQVHAGRHADRFLRRVGMPAACLGNRVILSRWVLADTGRVVAAIGHELTHLAAVRSERVLRGWNAAIHAALSREACNACFRYLHPVVRAAGLQWDEFLLGVANAASNMDIRHRFAHPWDTLTYLIGAEKGEGPRHGEGRNYTSTSQTWNANLNVAEQRRHAWIAANEFLNDLGNRSGSLRLLPGDFFFGPQGSKSVREFEAKHIGGVTVWEREWVKSLANSLHVAQDRGSHREGIKGYGHSDRRDGKEVEGRKWSCDEPWHEHSMGRHWLRCSMAAYNVAFNNSTTTVHDFIFYVSLLLKKRRLITKHLPMPVVGKRPDTCHQG